MMNTGIGMKGKAMAALVAACMLLCVLSPAIVNWNEEDSSAYVDNGGMEKDAFTYVSLGDSMVNGFGMFGYYPEEVYPENDHNWNGFNMIVPNAFPAKLAGYIEEELDVKVDLIQLGVSAMRSAELRAILDPTFMGDERTQDLMSGESGAFNDCMEGLPEGYEQDVDGFRQYYIDTISAAELISYCFHYDFGYTLTQDVIMSFIEDGVVEEIDFSPYIDEEYIAMFEQVSAMIGAYVDSILTANGIDLSAWSGMIDFVTGVVKGLAYVTLSYCINFDKNMEQILKLNPDVDILVVDSYNTFKGMQMVVGDIEVPLGDIYGYTLELSNIYAKYLSPYSLRTNHVSIDDYPTLFTDKFKDVDLENPDLTGQDKAVFFKTLMATIDDDPNIDEGFVANYDFIDGYLNTGDALVPLPMIKKMFPSGEVFEAYTGLDAAIYEKAELIKQGNLTKFLKVVFSSTDLDWTYFTEKFDEAENMLNNSVPKLFPNMDDLESNPGYLLTGSVTYNDDGSCTVSSPLYSDDEYEGVITFSKGDLSMLWMNFYVMAASAVMSHPSIEGHQYVYDLIIDEMDFLSDIDYGYYEGDFMNLTSEDLGIESARTVDIAFALQNPESDEAKEIIAALEDSNAILAEVNSGNLMFLANEFMSYFMDPEYELDYFQYSTLLGGMMSGTLDSIEAKIIDSINELRASSIDAQTFIEGFQEMVWQKIVTFVNVHDEVAVELIKRVLDTIQPIVYELYLAYPDEVEEFGQMFIEKAVPAIQMFIQVHPEYFRELIVKTILDVNDAITAFISENQDMIQFIAANIDDIIVEYFDNLKAEGLAFFQSLDPLIFTIERLIYSQVSMYQGMVELDAAVKAINPLATVFYAGLYNPLSGVTVVAGDVVVPIGKIMDLYVNLSNYAINEMCMAMDATVYVDVTGYAGTFTPADLVIDIAEIDPSALMGETEEVNPSMEAILSILLRVTMDGEYIENSAFEIMDSMVELPVYNTYWYDGNGKLLFEAPKALDKNADSDAYVYGEDVPKKDKDADYRYEFKGTWTSVEDGHDLSYIADFNAIPLKPTTEVKGTEATVDVGTILKDPEVTDVVVKNEVISVSIPRDVFEGCETAVVTMKVVEQKDLPGSFLAFTEGKKVISLELFLDGVKTSDFGENEITVSVDYALAEGEDASTLAVWYMNENTMTLDKVESEYVDGKLVITMDHFSYWVIGHEVVDDEEDDAFPVAVAVLLLVVAGLCISMLRLKK